MNRKINRILIISKLYPPDESARALQMGKVLKAINKSGCSTYVIAGVNIDLYSKHKVVSNGKVTYVPYKSSTNSPSLFNRFMRKFYAEINSDNPYSEWIRNCYKLSRKTIEHYKPDIIMTIYTPFDAHMVGLLLKKQYKLPWVASFSDPWPMWINPYPYNIYKIPLISSWQMLLLRKVLRTSDAILMTNNTALDLMGKSSNVNISSKSWAIPHVSTKISNYDNGVNKEKNGWIAHIGDFTKERYCPSLFEAIQDAVKKGLNDFKGLMLIGYVCNQVKLLIEKYDLRNHVILIDHKDQSDAMKFASECSALLVIEAKMPFSPFLPSKYVDYIATNTPIIAITPIISPIRDYSKKISDCYVVNHDKNEIYSAISRIFQNSKYVHRESKQIFSDNIIGNKYKQLFDSIVN